MFGKLKILGIALGVAAFVACSDDSGANASTNASGKDDSALTDNPQSITSGSSAIEPVVDISSSAAFQNSSSATTQDAGPSSSGEYCTVSRDENAVWSDMGIDGKYTSKTIVTKNSEGSVNLVYEYWFASSKANDYICSAYKSDTEDENMSVECGANTTVVSQIDLGSFDDYEAQWKESCSEVDYDGLREKLKSFE